MSLHTTRCQLKIVISFSIFHWELQLGIHIAQNFPYFRQYCGLTYTILNFSNNYLLFWAKFKFIWEKFFIFRFHSFDIWFILLLSFHKFLRNKEMTIWKHLGSLTKFREFNDGQQWKHSHRFEFRILKLTMRNQIPSVSVNNFWYCYIFSRDLYNKYILFWLTDPIYEQLNIYLEIIDGDL